MPAHELPPLGPKEPSAGHLKSALESCSYRNEVILLTSTASVLDNSLQLYSSILQLGLAHMILLTDSSEVRGGACRGAT
jgi:hypothetical protein